jgi:exoribonuclease-2
MLDRQLEPDFPPAALAELAHIPGPAHPDGAGGGTRPGGPTASGAAAAAIRDLRELPWCSIDNDDSRDLDQLTVAEGGGQGGGGQGGTAFAGTVKVLVAVADVDALVARGSALDGHAGQNTTSVYTAAEIFPMLPERLSTDLTSLGEGEDRLAIVVEMEVADDGSVAGSDVYRAQVRNQAKLAYNGVGAWIEGKGPAPPRLAAVPGLDAQLRLQDAAAQRLRALRHQHGALELQTLQSRAVYAGDQLTGLEVDVDNRAKQLIEDFMIAANGVAARFLGAKGLPALRRVLRPPERWDRIVALAAALGTKLPAAPDAVALNQFLADRLQSAPAQFPDLSLSIIKLLGSGEYQVERPGVAAPGHFGLAVGDYAHSTAPNRRFPDVITQRLLKAALAATPPAYSLADLDTLAAHCTLQEGNAKKVERLVQKAAAAFLLAPKIGQQFDGIVTGSSDKGVWVRISQPIAEGKVIKGAEGMQVGDKVRVQLLHTDPARGFIDFARTR